MTVQSLPFNGADCAPRKLSAQARKENLVALAFAVFALAFLSLVLLPPHPASDSLQVDALEVVAGP